MHQHPINGLSCNYSLLSPYCDTPFDKCKKSNRGSGEWFGVRCRRGVEQWVQGWSQGRLSGTAASHHLIMLLLFHTVASRDWCVCVSLKETETASWKPVACVIEQAMQHLCESQETVQSCQTE